MEMDWGTYLEGAVCFRGKIFKSCFFHYSCPPLFSPCPPFSLSPSPSFSLSHFLSISLSCGFFLDWVLADVKNDFVDCNLFEMWRTTLLIVIF